MEKQKTLLDLQLDHACNELRKLIKLGKILPDYNQIWRDFARQTFIKTRQKVGKCLTK